jgi:hypothetical protein
MYKLKLKLSKKDVSVLKLEEIKNKLKLKLKLKGLIGSKKFKCKLNFNLSVKKTNGKVILNDIIIKSIETYDSTDNCNYGDCNYGDCNSYSSIFFNLYNCDIFSSYSDNCIDETIFNKIEFFLKNIKIKLSSNNNIKSIIFDISKTEFNKLKIKGYYQ